MERIRGTQSAGYGHTHIVCAVVVIASIPKTSLVPCNTEGLTSTLAKTILLYNEWVISALPSFWTLVMQPFGL